MTSSRAAVPLFAVFTAWQAVELGLAVWRTVLFLDAVSSTSPVTGVALYAHDVTYAFVEVARFLVLAAALLGVMATSRAALLHERGMTAWALVGLGLALLLRTGASIVGRLDLSVDAMRAGCFLAIGSALCAGVAGTLLVVALRRTARAQSDEALRASIAVQVPNLRHVPTSSHDA
jgi:hypothetical protein